MPETIFNQLLFMARFEYTFYAASAGILALIFLIAGLFLARSGVPGQEVGGIFCLFGAVALTLFCAHQIPYAAEAWFSPHLAVGRRIKDLGVKFSIAEEEQEPGMVARSRRKPA